MIMNNLQPLRPKKAMSSFEFRSGDQGLDKKLHCILNTVMYVKMSLILCLVVPGFKKSMLLYNSLIHPHLYLFWLHRNLDNCLRQKITGIC